MTLLHGHSLIDGSRLSIYELDFVIFDIEFEKKFYF